MLKWKLWWRNSLETPQNPPNDHSKDTLSHQETWRKLLQGNCLTISLIGNLETLIRKESEEESWWAQGAWLVDGVWLCVAVCCVWQTKLCGCVCGRPNCVGPNTHSLSVLHWLPCWQHLSLFAVKSCEIFPCFLDEPRGEQAKYEEEKKQLQLWGVISWYESTQESKVVWANSDTASPLASDQTAPRIFSSVWTMLNSTTSLVAL